MYCKYCGKWLQEDAKRCEYCGKIVIPYAKKLNLFKILVVGGVILIMLYLLSQLRT